MWPFDKNLTDVLGKTKDVRILGVKFKIKKIDPTAYMDGSKAMLQAFDTYKLDSVKQPHIDPAKAAEKVKEHYRDVFLAAIVWPKLKRKESDPEGIPVDNLFTEWELAHQLYSEIIAYTYGKKKHSLNS